MDTEVYELRAAKPLVDELITTKFRVPHSQNEKLILQRLRSILQNCDYNKQLLEKAGWNDIHLAFLKGRLAFYDRCEKRGLPIPNY